MAILSVDGVIQLLTKFVLDERMNSKRHIKFQGVIKPETRLLDDGLIDSLGFVTLMTFLEAETGLSIDLSDFEITDFETPTALHGALQSIAASR